jgi:ubiquinol-cytochrome c reductase iron-sulfur subunit
MRRLRRWLIAVAALAVSSGERPERDSGRLIPRGDPDRRAELAVVVLLLLAAASAAGFTVVYAIDSLGNRTQLFGITLGLSFAFLAAALIGLGKRLVSNEELADAYPAKEHPAAQREVAQLVHESGDRITRKRLMIAAGGAAGTAIGVAALAPALAFGPFLEPGQGLDETPWSRGRLLVDSDGRPLLADDISTEAFYTAYPEGAKRDKIGSPLVLVRLEPSALRLPAGRDGWAPDGILAFSKICTHAGCAISLYRNPQFPPVAPSRALVCPCHYSTFDPATGAEVIFGPAGRPLPQLPLLIDDSRHLRAAGNFSGPVGPGWGGVRGKEPT